MAFPPITDLSTGYRYMQRKTMNKRSTVLAVVVLSAVAIVARPTLALAHAELIGASPAKGATVAAPRELRLTFSEKLEIPLTRITMIAAGKDTVKLGVITADPKSDGTIIVPVVGTVRAATYTISWRTAGGDGHAMKGSYVFRVKL